MVTLTARALTLDTNPNPNPDFKQAQQEAHLVLQREAIEMKRLEVKSSRSKILKS